MSTDGICQPSLQKSSTSTWSKCQQFNSKDDCDPESCQWIPKTCVDMGSFTNLGTPICENVKDPSDKNCSNLGPWCQYTYSDPEKINMSYVNSPEVSCIGPVKKVHKLPYRMNNVYLFSNPDKQNELCSRICLGDDLCKQFRVDEDQNSCVTYGNHPVTYINSGTGFEPRKDLNNCDLTIVEDDNLTASSGLVQINRHVSMNTNHTYCLPQKGTNSDDKACLTMSGIASCHLCMENNNCDKNMDNKTLNPMQKSMNVVSAGCDARIKGSAYSKLQIDKYASMASKIGAYAQLQSQGKGQCQGNILMDGTCEGTLSLKGMVEEKGQVGGNLTFGGLKGVAHVTENAKAGADAEGRGYLSSREIGWTGNVYAGASVNVGFKRSVDFDGYASLACNSQAGAGASVAVGGTGFIGCGLFEISKGSDADDYGNVKINQCTKESDTCKYQCCIDAGLDADVGLQLGNGCKVCIEPKKIFKDFVEFDSDATNILRDIGDEVKETVSAVESDVTKAFNWVRDNL